MNGALPVVDLISMRGISIDSRCQICGLEGESVNHVLFTCTLARQIWVLSLFASPVGGFDVSSLYSNFHFLFKTSQDVQYPKEIRRLFHWVLWRLWKNRNTFIFEGNVFSPFDTVAKVREDVDFWIVAQQVSEEIDRYEVEEVVRTEVI